MKNRQMLSIILSGLTSILSACSNLIREEKRMEYEVSEIIIDESKINSDDVFAIIEPLWRSVSTCDGEVQYLEDLKKFTEPQKYILAIEWYIAEVNNGGHDQFYFNSTGIVWEDALKGFEVIELEDNYQILKESADRLGGSPSKNWDMRQNQMEEYDAQFDDLDDRFYGLEGDIEEALLRYIRANKQDFLYKGNVKIPK